MTTPPRTPATRPSRLLTCLCLVGLVLVVMPVLSGLIRYPYLPTPAAAAASKTAAVVAGIVLAALLLWTELSRTKSWETVYDKAKALFFTLTAPCLGYLVGYFIVTSGAPMAIALLAGHTVEHTYTVADVSGHDRRRCDAPITITGLPAFADTLCDYPKEFRSTLAPGDRIAVTGRGWQWGVIASDVRRID